MDTSYAVKPTSAEANSIHLMVLYHINPFSSRDISRDQQLRNVLFWVVFLLG